MRALVLLTDAFGGYGGISKFNRDLLTALCLDPRFSEVVAVPRLAPHQIENLPPKLRYVLDGLGSKFAFIRKAFQLALERPSFDLIVCAHINLLALAFFLRFWLRVPVVLIIHGTDAWTPTQSIITNYFARRVRTFISVSEFTRKRFARWSRVDPAHGFLLPNSVMMSQFGPEEKDDSLLAKYGLRNRTILLTVSRLSSVERGKGIDEVMYSLSRLSAVVPNISYLIVGDGTDRQRLEKKSVSLGVRDRVVFAGRIPEEEKAKHYRLADAFVMPGRLEGFGIAYLEALACGIPVVGSKLDASCEVLQNGRLGVVVNPDDPGELCSGILEALQRRERKVPEALQDFSFDRFVERLSSIIGKLLVAGTR